MNFFLKEIVTNDTLSEYYKLYIITLNSFLKNILKNFLQFPSSTSDLKFLSKLRKYYKDSKGHKWYKHQLDTTITVY